MPDDLRARIAWSAVYEPAWDGTPDAYLAAGAVAWGRTRRLGRLAAGPGGPVAYVGVQHVDPARWGLTGAPASRFFASCRRGGQVWLRTYPTMAAALAGLARVLTADETRG